MKKLLLALSILSFLHAGLYAQELPARQVVGVAENGIYDSYRMPFDTWYKHACVQIVYTADQMQHTAGVIDTLWFRCSAVDSAAGLDTLVRIYMGHSILESSTEWQDGLQLVYESRLRTQPNQTGWAAIPLQVPFAYNGNDNLAVAISHHGTIYSADQRYFCDASPLAVRCSNSDNDFLAGELGGALEGTQYSMIPATRFSMQAMSQQCPRVEGLWADSITAYSASLYFLPALLDSATTVSAYRIAVYVGTTQVGEYFTADTLYQLVGLTPNTNYRVRVFAQCDGNAEGLCDEVHFATLCSNIDRIPYYCSFEHPQEYDPCWSWSGGIIANQSRSGERGFLSTQAGAILALPELAPNIIPDSCSLVFWASANPIGMLSVGHYEGANFVADHQVALADTCQEFLFPISHRNVAFRCTGAGVLIDDVSIVPQGGCAPPTQLHQVAQQQADRVAVAWAETVAGSQVAYGPHLFSLNDTAQYRLLDSVAGSQVEIGNLLPLAQDYDVYVRSSCSRWCGPVVVRKGCALLGSVDTVYLCDGEVADDGGIANPYRAGQDQSIILKPATMGAQLQLNGSINLISHTYLEKDTLYLYDGIGCDTSLLAAVYTDSLELPTMVSTGGAWTLRLVSHGWQPKSTGFHFSVRCVGDSACIAPTNLRVDRLTDSTAQVVWRDHNGATSFLVAYGLADSFNLADTATFEQVSANGCRGYISGLQPNTQYRYAVKAQCYVSSPWSIPSDIDTRCPQYSHQAMPYFENLESTPLGSVPDCWVAGGSQMPYVLDGVGADGGRAIYLDNYGGGYAYVALPMMDDELNQVSISFDAVSAYMNEEQLLVGVLTDPYDISTFELLDSFTMLRDYGHYTCTPIDYRGEGRYLSLMAPQCGNFYAYGMYVDNFEVEYLSPCRRPVLVTAAAIDCHSAQVSVMDTVHATMHQVRWGRNPMMEQAMDSMLTADTAFVLTGLLSDCQYYVWVRNYCDSQSSPWSNPATFHTQVSCQQPEHVRVLSTTNNSVWLRWDGTFDNQYVILADNRIIPVADTQFVVTQLLPGTDYWVQVQQVCQVGDTSRGIKGVWVRTLCDEALPLPYEENFDRYQQGVAATQYPAPDSNYRLPDCWNTPFVRYHSSDVYMTNNANYACQGNSLVMYSSQQRPAVAMLPLMDVAVDSLKISVLVRTPNTVGTELEIGVSTSMTDTDSYRPIWSQRLGHAGFDTVQFDFSETPLSHDSLYYITLVHRVPSNNRQPAVLDNLQVSRSTECAIPTGLLSQVTAEGILLRWDSVDADSYEVAYRILGMQAWTLQRCSQPQLLLDELLRGTAYEAQVRSYCAVGVGRWSETTAFSTPMCAVSETAYVGDESSEMTSNEFPYSPRMRHSYTQQIFHAEELPQGDNLEGFTFFNQSSAVQQVNLKVYLGNSDLVHFSSRHDYLPIDSLQLVYEGLFDVVPGANTLAFDTPFTHNVSRNLVLAVLKNSDEVNNAQCFQTSSSSSDRLSMSFVSSTEAIDPGDLENRFGTLRAERDNLLFYACHPECPPVVDLAVASYELDGNMESVLRWQSDGAVWEVSYGWQQHSFSAIVDSREYPLPGLNVGDSCWAIVRTLCSGAYQSSSPWCDTLHFVAGEHLGIDTPLQTALGVYPNPATTSVTLTAPAPILQVDVLDLLGRKVRHAESTQHISLVGLEKGIYILWVTTAEGVIVSRVMKQ